MLEVMMEGRVPYVLMGILTVIGIWSKIVVHVSLKRLVGAAGSMNKSNHPLMRLVKAKFEHACMVSDTVENVGVFVDKYLYEYRVFGSEGWKRPRPQDVFSWEPQERQAGMCCGEWETWCCRQGPREPPLRCWCI